MVLTTQNEIRKDVLYDATKINLSIYVVILSCLVHFYLSSVVNNYRLKVSVAALVIPQKIPRKVAIYDVLPLRPTDVMSLST